MIHTYHTFLLIINIDYVYAMCYNIIKGEIIMEIIDCISKRISIRKFKDKPIDDDKIMSILESGRIAPSAKNRQPWKFFVARGETKQKIVDAMIKWNDENKNNGTSVHATAIAISQAPVLILVFKDSDSQFVRSDTLSIGGAVENMILTATGFGLGSLWIADTVYVENEIAKIVGTDLPIYSAIALGYANEMPNARHKKSLDDILIK